ncbi:MAG: hypothetical protein HY519_01795 [Candidatus Aenigmarchaeota archaeon]|nr:hypothetical protein [Candidatus Aenigmarchaeota archaeon]
MRGIISENLISAFALVISVVLIFLIAQVLLSGQTEYGTETAYRNAAKDLASVIDRARAEAGSAAIQFSLPKGLKGNLTVARRQVALTYFAGGGVKEVVARFSGQTAGSYSFQDPEQLCVLGLRAAQAVILGEGRCACSAFDGVCNLGCVISGVCDQDCKPYVNARDGICFEGCTRAADGICDPDCKPSQDPDCRLVANGSTAPGNGTQPQPNPQPTPTTLKVSPESGKKGTVFAVSATIDTTSATSAAALKLGASTVGSIALFDDGRHGDGPPGDKAFGAVWDSSSQAEGAYTMVLAAANVSVETAFTVEAATAQGDACLTLRDSGRPADKLDVLFLGDGYANNQEKFLQDARTHYAKLMATEPFKSQANKINVHAAKEQKPLGCYYGCAGIDRLLCCDTSKVEQAASQCPGDSKIVLVNNPKYGGSGGTITISYSADPTVMIHEFGHSFGKLMDEYTSEAIYWQGKPLQQGRNCDVAGCPQWSSLAGASCIPGCTSPNWYRAKQSNSIMLDKSGDFNPVGERVISALLDNYA